MIPPWRARTGVSASASTLAGMRRVRPPIAAVSVAMTCARTCVASSSCASCAALRGRASSTAIGAPSVAGGPGSIGTIQSDSRIASSTLLVIITVVTGRSRRRAQPHQVLLQRLAGQRVERAERFVEKQHFGVGGEGARDRHPLPHAARQLAGPAVERVAEPDLLERAPCPATCCLARERRERRLHREAHVLERREPRQQRVVLEDERRVAADAAHRLRRRRRRCRCRRW